ncbi:dihydropteroate synthase [Anaeromyxobacter dehalogenans 2CP-1]|uniref:Dihydropteroate synthase n=1 Tax=Anaeromyxobacter dehalogenans (strain ATCC BAA-258 / DSM 21875 / 2CP-1) TaxID=455488 RepID=B8JBH0_ANAD2|nr:dihydropteroate synthase [Anaeromyxobacter dehalogenans]ACL65797.1 dihydropteroate synthase [Anaeromyxobacter dehalogenans 2CP-1]
MRMRIGARLFDGPGPFVMGVVNATPDSFSDGGRFLERDAAVAHALRLADEGADLVDLGGESTRPGAPPVTADEELRRVVPVVAALRARGFTLPISVDTWKARVAREALAAGADLVNDVTGLADPDMGGVVAGAGVPIVLQHMRGTFADMATRAVYADVVEEVAAELDEALARAGAAGIPRDRVVLDPGIGFAKDARQSLELLARVGELRRLGCPLLVGPSRKSFIGKVTGAPAAERLPGTLAAVTACVLAGVELVRVHDVAAARQAADVAAAIRGAARAPGPL